jgi:hypothetical protein
MRIQYQSQLEEIVDAHLRMISYSREKLRSRILNTLWSALALAILPILLMTHEKAAVRFGLAFLGLIVGGLFQWFMYPWSMRRQVRRLIREAMGGADTVDVEIELTQLVIQVRSNATTVALEWSNLTSIKDEPNIIEFKFGSKGIVVVQKRALQGQEHADALLQLAQSYGPTATVTVIKPGLA